jgi:hypothetical protein
MPETLTIQIADLAIALTGDVKKEDLEIPSAYQPFVRSGPPHLRLQLRRSSPEIAESEKVFDCPPIWSLSRRNGQSFLRIFGDLCGLERTLVLGDNPQSAELFLGNASGASFDPFYGPTVELLIVHFLAKGSGIILHSCGISRNGMGLLFVGESGAGKSTLARMWSQETGVTILSDDRIVVRKRGEEFWAYGTPWHGEAAFASPAGAKLERVFFLKHGEENSVAAVTGMDAVTRLVTSSFPPFWDSRGTAFSLDFLAELAASVPCEELTFTPDRRAVELVKNLSPARPAPAGLR